MTMTPIPSAEMVILYAVSKIDSTLAQNSRLEKLKLLPRHELKSHIAWTICLDAC